MRLEKIIAFPHPNGNRIDLTWVNPDPSHYPKVRVLRKEKTCPTSIKDGEVVVHDESLSLAMDQNLKGETVYYYALIPYRDDRPEESDFDPYNRISTMATSPYNFAAVMYDLLPRLYHRYDNPASNQGASNQTEQLRRFLELPGRQLDQLYSLARSMLELLHLEDVDGRLLPLFAQWIGWSLDHRQEFDRQRNEIRDAPYVQDTIGIIPTLEATVKRLFGWESRTKEFVHNIFLSNSPPRLNLYVGEAGKNRWLLPSKPLSLDFAYEGRPSAVITREGFLPDSSGWSRLWLFYHTRRKEQWEIWYKTLDTFHLDFPFAQLTVPGLIPNKLLQAFESQGLTLSGSARILPILNSASGETTKWQIVDDENLLIGTLEPEGEAGTQARLWCPSKSITDGPGMNRHPTAAVQAPTLLRAQIWLFWDVYDEQSRSWRIDCRIYRPQAGWIPCKSWPFDPQQRERKCPCVISDDRRGIWLFWLERNDQDQWRLKYKRHNGSKWQSLEGGSDVPEIEVFQPIEDLFVLFDNKILPPSVWVFGSRKKKDESGNLHWEIVYLIMKVKRGLGNNYLLKGVWGEEVFHYPSVSPADDREPSAWLNENGKIELFWSSNRKQDPEKPSSWSILHSVLESAETNLHHWLPAEAITGNPYMQRDPLPVRLAAGSLLFFRSNENLKYSSSVYGATETLDARYAGSTTVDTKALAQTELKGYFEDFQTYTYETNQNGEPLQEPRYNRETAGIYLDDLSLTENEQREYKSTLQQFMPLGVKPLFLVEPKDEQQPTRSVKLDKNR